MPNWCNTSISIQYGDSDKLKQFYDNVYMWLKKTYKSNDFDKYSEGWLGNIVGNSGLAKWVKNGEREDFEPNISCRGYVTDIAFHDSNITINTETAWSPMMKIWDMLRERYLPDAEIFFTAEECGNLLFVSNDPDTIGKYYIDVYDEPPEDCEEIEMEYEASKDYAIQLLQKAFKTDETDIDKLIEMANDSEWITVHEWEEVSISDYCD